MVCNCTYSIYKSQSSTKKAFWDRSYEPQPHAFGVKRNISIHFYIWDSLRSLHRIPNPKKVAISCSDGYPTGCEKEKKDDTTAIEDQQQPWMHHMDSSSKIRVAIEFRSHPGIRPHKCASHLPSMAAHHPTMQPLDMTGRFESTSGERHLGSSPEKKVQKLAGSTAVGKHLKERPGKTQANVWLGLYMVVPCPASSSDDECIILPQRKGKRGTDPDLQTGGISTHQWFHMDSHPTSLSNDISCPKWSMSSQLVRPPG